MDKAGAKAGICIHRKREKETQMHTNILTVLVKKAGADWLEYPESEMEMCLICHIGAIVLGLTTNVFNQEKIR